jgi:hypothetical protein
MGVAARVSKKTFGNALIYLQRMPKEYETLCVKLAYQRDPLLQNAPEFAQWYNDNQEVFKR